MKPFRLLFLLSLLPFYAEAQTQNVTVAASIPPPVLVNASYSGASGQNSLYYYVCAVYTTGYVCQYSPAVAGRTTGTLGGGNSVTVNWSSAPDALSYYVMRYTAPGLFSGSCSGCVVGAAVTGTSYVDSSSSPPSGSFPPGGLGPVQPASGLITLDNLDFSPAALLWNLGATWPIAMIPPSAVVGQCATYSAEPPFLASVPCAAGTITGITAGSGLTGGGSSGNVTIACATATSSVQGCSEPDGSTITASSGKYTTASTTVNGATCTPGSSCNDNYSTGSITANHLAKFSGTGNQIEDGGAIPPTPPSNSNVLQGNGSGGFGTGYPVATSSSPPALSTDLDLPTLGWVQNAIDLSMATVPFTGITGGTYSFAGLGSGAVINVTASSGVITAATITGGLGGSGYAVGDLITCSSNGGNHDAVLRVATVSGTAAATLTVLYGGTNYANGTGGTTALAYTIPFTFELSGTLSSNATFIMPAGSLLLASNQWVVANNTTGAYTVLFCLTNGSDACTGTGVTIPQGSGNVPSSFIWTDGQTDIWFIGTPTTVNGANCIPGGSCNGNYSTGAITTNHLAKFSGTGNQIEDGGAIPVSPTSNQNLRTVGGVLTPTSLTACVFVPFAGTVTAFHAVAGDGATADTVLVKIETQPTFATFISTGVSGASDITNGGEQLTSVLGLVDTTLSGWTTSVTAGTTVCFVGSTFSAGTSVNANVTIAAN